MWIKQKPDNKGLGIQKYVPSHTDKYNNKNERRMKKGRVILAGLAIAGLAVLNFTHASGEVVSNVQASTTTSVSQEPEQVQLAWSAPIRCHKRGRKRNSYSICIVNGTGNPCDTPNATTCDCGKNCR